MRVSMAVGVFTTGGLVWTGAGAATGHDINVTGDAAKCDKTWGPPCFTPANGTVTSISAGDTVTWHVLDGTHTVTPVDPAAFARFCVALSLGWAVCESIFEAMPVQATWDEIARRVVEGFRPSSSG